MLVNIKLIIFINYNYIETFIKKCMFVNYEIL